MNLSLTPINEAWNVEKKRSVHHNKFATKDHQTKMLSESGHSLSLSTPTGYDGHSFAMHYGEKKVVTPKPEPEPEINNDFEFTIKIADNDLLNTLRPYKKEHITRVVEDFLREKLTQVELFSMPAKNNHDTLYVILIIVMIIMLM